MTTVPAWEANVRAATGPAVRRLIQAAATEPEWRFWEDAQCTNMSARAHALHHAVTRLLAGWPLEDVELAAWEFALDGWQRTPPLSEDYDLAFAMYLGLIKHFRLDNMQRAGLTTLGVLIEELRNRVQFLQSRAADIRLTAHQDRLLEVARDRLVPVVTQLATTMEKAKSPTEALASFESEGRGGLLHAVAHAVGTSSPAAGAAVLQSAPLFDGLKRVIAALPEGVAGNATYDAIKFLLSAAS